MSILFYLKLALIPLAVWRLYKLMATDTGPWQLLRRFRQKLGVRYAEDESGIDWSHWSSHDGSFADGLTCIWCASVWWSEALVAIILYTPSWLSNFIILPLAVSASVIIFEQKFYNKGG